MSKEKLSAEKFYDKHGGFVIDDKWDAFNFAEAYAQHVTEQLQRDLEEAKNLIVGNVEAFASGDSIARMNAIQKAIDFLTPKPEK